MKLFMNCFLDRHYLNIIKSCHALVNFSFILPIINLTVMLRSPIAMTIFILFFSSCNITEPAESASVSEVKKDTVSVIFDTDMGPDYDDVGAIAMLHAFADEGSANILATIASTKYAGVAEVLDVFNT